MDMGLYQAVKESPLWFQACVVIATLGAIFNTLQLLYQISKRGIIMIRLIPLYVKRIFGWAYNQYIWIPRKPSLNLVEKPSLIVARRDADAHRITYSTSIKIRLKGRVKENVEIMYRHIYMDASQTWRGSSSKIHMKLDINNVERFNDHCFYLRQPESKEIMILLEFSCPIDNSVTNFRVDKPYKWKISRITAKVEPLDFRNIKTFKGNG